MKRPVRFAVLGLAAYLVALVVTFPAQQAVGLLSPYLKNSGVALATSGLEGTVWSGRAAAVAVNGKPVGSVSWAISPWSLFIGRLGVHWGVQVPDGYLSGNGYVGILGGGVLRQVEGRVPAPLLARYLPALPLPVQGTVSLRLDQLALEGGKLARLQGTAVWHQAAVVASRPVKLGDLKLSLAAKPDGGVVGRLGDGGGPLQASGELSMTPDRRYRLNARLAVRKGAQPELEQALALLGRRDAQGRVEIKRAGRL